MGEVFNEVIEAGLLDPRKKEDAIAVLDSPAVEVNYLNWSEALARTKLIEPSNVNAAANLMEAAGKAEAEQDQDKFEQGLENAGIL